MPMLTVSITAAPIRIGMTGRRVRGAAIWVVSIANACVANMATGQRFDKGECFDDG